MSTNEVVAHEVWQHAHQSFQNLEELAGLAKPNNDSHTADPEPMLPHLNQVLNLELQM